MAERYIDIFYRQILRRINDTPIIDARLCVTDGASAGRWVEAEPMNRDTFVTAGHPKVALERAIHYAETGRFLFEHIDPDHAARLAEDSAYLKSLAAYDGLVSYSESQETYVADHSDGADELGVPDTRLRMNEPADAACSSGGGRG